MVFSEKLISLLATFSKVERNRFRKFLLSPYLNEQLESIRLFDLVDQHLRIKSEVINLSKEAVWGKLYPEKKFDDAHLRRLSSELNRSALQFLVAENRQNNPIHETLELQNLLGKLPLQKHLMSVERELHQILEENDGQSTDYFLSQFFMHHNIFKRASKVVATAGYIDKMAPADFYLECFYILQKLKFYVAWLQFSGVRTTEKQVQMIPGFWDHLADERFSNIPAIKVYRTAILCFQEPEIEENFKQFLSELEKFESVLIREDLREHYQIAQNYCALKVNQGETQYYQIFFQVLRKAVQLNLIIQDNQLSEGVFKNMVSISMWVGEYSWAEGFIQEYAGYLPASLRENARQFSLANLYFHQKKHGKVIELLQNIEYNDIVYALGSKLILLRTYYECGESLALSSLMDSFRIYIRRNKELSKSQKREYNNFLNYVKKLSILAPSDKRAIQKFREKALVSSSTMPKKWLLEKIDELGKS